MSNVPTSKPKTFAWRGVTRWRMVAIGAAILVSAVLVAGVVLLPRTQSAVAPAPGISPPPAQRPPACDNLSPAVIGRRSIRSRPYPINLSEDHSYRAQIATSCGTLTVQLLSKQAPIAVNNFIHLAEDHFYDGQVFHRIDKTLGVIQAGDPACPTGIDICGTGGPGYTIRDDVTDLESVPGAVGMASAGEPNTSGSQFFIVAGKSDSVLPPRTVFGRLVGNHSRQVAKVILSVPTKVAPGAPEGAQEDYSDGEFVYITGIRIKSA